MRDRYYWRTIGYHVWGIFLRDDRNMDEATRPDSMLDRLVESVGANRRGDAAARDLCRSRVERLNAK